MCGIWGMISNKPTGFNKLGFNILGIENDTRGGDSCGVFIDGQVEYGVDDLKLYSKFFKTSVVVNNTKKASIALGHCRKASVGKISLETAQPVVLTNDNGDVEFVVMHNGTIHNYKELAQKYIPEIEIEGLTDSQVMARIFYYKGYDVLNEYFGAAVFVIVDYRTDRPTVYLWKGASKQYMASVNETEERPLYFVTHDKKFIFSSLGTYLKAYSNEPVYTLYSNILIQLDNGELYTIKEYPRKDVCQSNNYKMYNHYYDNYNNTSNWYNNKITNVPSTNTNTKDKINITDDGIYYIGESPLHGEYIVDCKGNIYDKLSQNSVKLYFWDGILLYNSQAFTFLRNACNRFSLCSTDVKYVMAEVLNYLSPYPISHPDYIPDEFFELNCKSKNDELMTPFTGTTHRFLRSFRESYVNGVRQGCIWNTSKEDAFNELKKTIDKININFAKLYKELYS